MIKIFVGSFIAFFAVACTNATPAGTVFVTESLEDVPSQSTSVDVVLTADEPTTLTLTLGVAEVDGARRIVNFSGTVVDNGGWEISYEGKGNPVNVGSAAAPVMAMPIKVQRYRKGLTGTKARQDMITLSADGTASVQ